MKGSVNRGFFAYLFLFVGIILGVVLVCISIMYLSPGAVILGYEYITEKNQLTITTYDGKDLTTGSMEEAQIINTDGIRVPAQENAKPISFETLSKVIIKANHVEFKLIHGEFNKIELNNQISGVTKAENYSKISVTKTYDSVAKVFTIIVTDQKPDLTITNNRSIYMFVKDADFSNLEIEVQTDSGNMNFGGETLSSKTPRSETFKSFKITSKTGNVVVSQYVNLTQNFDLSLEDAKLTVLGDLGTNAKKLSQANIKVDKGNVNIQNLYASKSVFKGTRTNVIAKDIAGNVNIGIVDGDFKAQNIGGNFVDEDEVVRNTKITLGEVKQDFTIPKGTAGPITVDKIGGITKISVTTAKVVIKQANGQVDLKTESGDIDILISNTNNSLVEIVTSSGNIRALLQMVAGTDNKITSNSGHITVYYYDKLEFMSKVKTTKNIHYEAENLSNPAKNEDGYIYGYPSPIDNKQEMTNVLTVESSTADIIISAKPNVSWNLIQG